LIFIQDITAPETEVSIGKVTVPCNPTSLEKMASESVSIPSDHFCANGTQVVKSFHLRIIVTTSWKSNPGSTSRPSTRSRESNSSDLGSISFIFRTTINKIIFNSSGLWLLQISAFGVLELILIC
jgi:hypothetical protein